MGNTPSRQARLPAEVERRLDEAGSKQLSQLDLSQLRLETLPDAFPPAALSPTRALLLSRNLLTRLPLRLAERLPHITTLDLSHNLLLALPPDLTRFAHLQQLILTGNQLREVDHTLESRALRLLRRLDLGANRLAHIGPGVFGLPLLEHIVLRSNRLHSVPLPVPLPLASPSASLASASLDSPPFALMHLTRLDIARNCIQELPLALLDALPALLVLFASSNHIHCITTTLPASAPPDGRMAHPSGNARRKDEELSVSPRVMAAVKLPLDVRRASQSRSSVSKSSRSSSHHRDSTSSAAAHANGTGGEKSGKARPVTYPVSLQSMDLHENMLSSLPPFLSRMSCLGVLNLAQNQLSGLPTPLSHLVSLEALYLAQNKLSVLPDEIGCLTALDELDLSCNLLVSLPDGLSSMRCLRRLQLQRNLISVLSPTFWSLPSIRTLNLSSNRLSLLPKINSEHAPITASLSELHLSDNLFTDFPEALLHFANITSLGLSYNFISVLPDNINRLADLRLLFLSGNRLCNLPDKLKDIYGLRWVYANHNHLRVFPPTLADIPLEVFDFTGIEGESGPGNAATTIVGPSRRRVDGTRNQHKMSESKRFRVGFSDMIGRRQTMEDSILIRGSFRSSKSEDLFGVFDGHGTGGKGKIAADYLAIHIPRELETQLNSILGCVQDIPHMNGNVNKRHSRGYHHSESHSKNADETGKTQEKGGDMSKLVSSIQLSGITDCGEIHPELVVLEDGTPMLLHEEYSVEEKDERETKLIQSAIKNVFLKVNQDLCDEIKQYGDVIGSTAAIAYIKNKQLYVANAGDSRVILCREQVAIQLTMDHRPCLDSEQERIKRAGGFVSQNLRVNNELSVSRAFGDIRFSSIVCAEPYMVSIAISRPRDQFIVIACDGLFDVMSNQQVVNQVLIELQKPSPSAVAAASRLRDMAYQLGSTDNISVIVILTGA